MDLEPQISAVDRLLFVSKRASALAAALLCLAVAHLAGVVAASKTASASEVRVLISH